jgi:hypothetical protein
MQPVLETKKAHLNSSLSLDPLNPLGPVDFSATQVVIAGPIMQRAGAGSSSPSDGNTQDAELDIPNERDETPVTKPRETSSPQAEGAAARVPHATGSSPVTKTILERNIKLPQQKHLGEKSLLPLPRLEWHPSSSLQCGGPGPWAQPLRNSTRTRLLSKFSYSQDMKGSPNASAEGNPSTFGSSLSPADRTPTGIQSTPPGI